MFKNPIYNKKYINTNLFNSYIFNVKFGYKWLNKLYLYLINKIRMVLKFWCDPVSQPWRTIYYIIKKCKIEHQYFYIQLFKDTRSEEYKKNVNPKGTVPVIEHDGQKIFESATQARYK